MFNFFSGDLKNYRRGLPESSSGRAGFTLIEILVVVAIIALLAGTVLVGLGTVTQKGRDARRVSDLKSVQVALELYFTKTGSYPLTMDWTSLRAALKGAIIGADNVPVDPRNVDPYVYTYGSDGSDYRLRAVLEDKSSPLLSTANRIVGTTFTVNCGALPDNSGNYCVSP